MNLPSGTVTFLFTDIEGSARLWDEHPEEMRVALSLHDSLLRETIESHDGYVFKTIGDAFCSVFASAPDALSAAIEVQLRIETDLTSKAPALLLRIRMSLHTGASDQRNNDYFGQPLNRVARILAAAHGGQVLMSLPTQELVRDTLPVDVSLKYLGEHRLKDLLRPERVYQLVHPQLCSDFPPLRSRQVIANNIPTQLTSFIGREKEIAEIKQILEFSRLLTVTGSGGCGKTRTALQAVAEIETLCADGIWLFELAPLHEASQIMQSVRTALQLREEANRTDMETVTSFLQNREAILLFDNCEHLIAPASALIQELLSTCPAIKIIATSREPLGIPGEIIRRVPSLAVPEEGVATPQKLSSCESVQLFIDRALSNNPNFTLSEENAGPLQQICRRLDGIPLAIELAASRTKALSPRQIAQRLNDRFRLLVGGSRAGLPRHQTLQAAIDWSFDLLTPEERLVLCRLSVFSGSWSLEAAEYVCADPEVSDLDGEDPALAIRRDWGSRQIETENVLDIVCMLVDKSLVLADQQGNDEQRYRILESVRQYASEQLVRTNDPVLPHVRHLELFLRVAEEAESLMKGPEQASWQRKLTLDLDNLRMAMQWCRSTPEDASKGLRIAVALSRFWRTQGRLNEGREWLADFLMAEKIPPYLASRALHDAVQMAEDAGDTTRSIEWGLKCLQLARESGDAWLVSWALMMAGYAHKYEDPDATRDLLRSSLEGARLTGDVRLLAEALATYGFCELLFGEVDHAKELLTEGYECACSVEDLFSIGETEFILGLVSLQKGDHAAATLLFRDSLDHWATLGYERGMALSRDNLARLLLSNGRADEARLLVYESLEIRWRQGNKIGIHFSLDSCATYAFVIGRSEQAARLFGFTEERQRSKNYVRIPVHELFVQRDLSRLESLAGKRAKKKWMAAGALLTYEQAIAEAYALFE